MDEATKARFPIGAKVLALIDMTDDLTDDGMGVMACANHGDTLIVRGHSDSGRWLHVSHEHITDRAFCALPTEVEIIAQENQHG